MNRSRGGTGVTLIALVPTNGHIVGETGFPPAVRPDECGPIVRTTEVCCSMAEQFVAKASEMKDGDRRIVFMGEHEVGVFKEKGEYYAYSNFCLHQGGPACEGLTIAKVEEKIMPDKTSRGLYFSETELHFVCPWHGMEYDMKTGECVSDRKMKLRKYKIVQKGDDIYVAT